MEISILKKIKSLNNQLIKNHRGGFAIHISTKKISMFALVAIDNNKGYHKYSFISFIKLSPSLLLI